MSTISTMYDSLDSFKTSLHRQRGCGSTFLPTLVFLCALFVAHDRLAVSFALPPMPTPADNPTTPGKVALGRQLFFDPRLSANGTVSCSTCHQPQRGWGDGRRVAVGILNRSGTRNAPTIVNAAYQRLVFWDGRAALVEGQALLPLTNVNEMGNQSIQQVVNRLNLVPRYVEDFRREFGTPVTAITLAKSLASFERTVISYDAPIDRYLAGDVTALSAQSRRGFEVFERVGCMQCHRPPHFRDGGFHNTGVARRLGEDEQGRFTISRRQDDLRAFKTATLREVQRTAPYAHSGRLATLEAVVEHYNRGGSNDPLQDSRIRPLSLSVDERANLVRFLSTAFASPHYPLITEPELP